MANTSIRYRGDQAVRRAMADIASELELSHSQEFATDFLWAFEGQIRKVVAMRLQAQALDQAKASTRARQAATP